MRRDTNTDATTAGWGAPRQLAGLLAPVVIAGSLMMHVDSRAQELAKWTGAELRSGSQWLADGLQNYGRS